MLGHNSWVSAITFSPDGQTLISGSRDDTIKVWDLQSSECLKTFDNKPYASMKIKDVQGLTEVEKATLKALGAVEDGEM